MPKKYKCPACDSELITHTGVKFKLWECSECGFTSLSEDAFLATKKLICPSCTSGHIYYRKESHEYECLECGFLSLSENSFLLLNKIYEEKEQKVKLTTSRRELVKALATEYEYSCITQDDIIDQMVEIELHNQKCKKKVTK